jgi:DNA-binding transcriptional ArsR family regulator
VTKDPRQAITPDAATLRVLAHPMRLTLLRRLRDHGPATARALAAEYGIDSGAASYHLRRLAAGGLIEEDTGRGTRRDRWWRASHPQTHHDPAELSAQAQPDSRAYVQALVLSYAEELRRQSAQVSVMPEEWYRASVFADYPLRLDPAGLNELKWELIAVIDRYRGRAGGDPVAVQLQAFPLAVPPS